MKKYLKSFSFFIAGVLLSAGLLYFYAETLFGSPGDPAEADLPAAVRPAEPGDAVITRISGEVFLIRNDEMIQPLPGDEVQQGDVIKVVDDSLCQVRFAGTASLHIRSNTLVRIRKLLSGSKDADIRTELLTGSMIYKVEELGDSENLQILAQERIYRVEGTEFMVQALSGGRTALSVLGGKVSVLSVDSNSNEVFLKSVEANEKLVLGKGEAEVPDTQSLGREEQKIFEEESPEEFSVQRDDLIFLEISSRPAGAQIYIDGRLNGRSEASGLFLPDQEITILVRKRGYRDKSQRVIPGELENRRLILELSPLGAEQTLKEETIFTAEESPVDQLKRRHLEELADMRSSFTQKLARADSTTASLRKSESFLTDENIKLEEELAKSRKESEKLRELIKQIQELADDQ